MTRQIEDANPQPSVRAASISVKSKRLRPAIIVRATNGSVTTRWASRSEVQV